MIWTRPVRNQFFHLFSYAEYKKEMNVSLFLQNHLFLSFLTYGYL